MRKRDPKDQFDKYLGLKQIEIGCLNAFKIMASNNLPGVKPHIYGKVENITSILQVKSH